MKTAERSDKFILGAFILSIAGIIVRIIGAFFRVPLGNILSLEAMGYYSAAYQFYTLFIVLATAGLPTAVARLVAESKAVNDARGVENVLKVGLGLMIGIGLFGTLTLLIFGEVIVNLIGNPGVLFSLRLLAPGVLLCTLMSVYRGYFQGLQRMTPFAVSMIFEQLARVIFGYTLAVVLLPMGAEYAAGGATFGATAGGFVGFLYIIWEYFRFRRKSGSVLGTDVPEPVLPSDHKTPRAKKSSSAYAAASAGTSPASSTDTSSADTLRSDKKSLLKKMIVLSVPITLGALVFPLIGVVDVALVVNRLQDIGFSAFRSNELFSMLTGYALTIVNFPQAVTAGIQIAIVPAIAEVFSTKRLDAVDRLIKTGIKLTIVITLPAGIGMSVMSQQIISLLYPAHQEAASITGAILAIIGVSVVFLGVFQTTTGIYQGIGRQNVPVQNLIVALLVKIVLTYVLVGMPELNIYGAAIATTVTYVVACMLNMIRLRSYANHKIDWLDSYIKPAIATLVMAAVSLGTYLVLVRVVRGSIATVGAIGLAMAVYLIATMLLGVLKEDDYKMLPGGSKLQALERKLFHRN